MLANNSPEERVKLTQQKLNGVLAAQERYAHKRGGARAMLKFHDLSGLDLRNRRLDEAEFSGACLKGARLYGSSLVRASLYCADLREADLRSTKLMWADLRGASFKGADLSYATLDGADLRQATMMLMGADGQMHRKEGEGVRGVNFKNASLRHVAFGRSSLDGADFSGALLEGASFRGATLTNARFTGAVLSGVNLAELKVPPEALQDCIVDVKPEAQAKAAALRGQIEAHQQWIASGGKSGAPAVLDGADLRPVKEAFAGRALLGLSARHCVALGIDFSDCQLQGAKFDGIDLRGSSFERADLSGVSLRSAKLQHVKFAGARFGNLRLRSGEYLPPNLLGAEACEEQFQGAMLEEPLAVLGFSPGGTDAVIE